MKRLSPFLSNFCNCKKNSMRYRYRWLLVMVGAAILLYTGCDAGLDGDFNENQPPETFLTVDEINLEDENRLSSQINISWWGNDPDGFITGFEVAVGDPAEEWTFTNSSDSTFILPITPGREFDDVLFSVRAVDNDDARDPNPASVVFPVKNTPPVVNLNPLELPPDSTFNIASFGWTISDPDGFQNILKTEIAFNDTTDESWIEIPLPEEEEDGLFITVVVNDNGSVSVNGDIFLGRGFRITDLTAENLRIDEINEFFVRVTDRAFANSEIVSQSWFIKQKNSDILILNDVGGLDTQNSLAFHSDALQEIGLTFDIWNITDGEAGGGRKVRLSEAFPNVINPTLRKTLAEWNYIYWISNDIDRNITFAQDILSDFFLNGGKLFTTIPMKLISDEDPIFSFIPVAALGELPPIGTGFQILQDTDVISQQIRPVLLTNQRIINVSPLIPIGGATPLYETDFRVRTVLGSTRDFEGDEYVAILNPENSFIFFGMDLQTIDSNNNIPELLQNLLIDELGFE